MKYIKTFEQRFENKSRNRKNFEYLTIAETNKLIDFIENYINNLNILDKIDELTLDEIEHVNFEYRTVYNNLIGYEKKIGSYSFYEVMDRYNIDNKLNYSTVSFRNSIFKIEDVIYKKYKNIFKNKLDKKIIELLESDPINFKHYYTLYEDDLNSVVKKGVEWMFGVDKFNI